MNIRNHTELLNYLVERFGLNTYLEIGVQNPANNFDKIAALNKVGVDPSVSFRNQTITKIVGNGVNYNYEIITPKTSDEFFNTGMNWQINDTHQSFNKFDLIFIDGLHTAEQVEKDFNNSLACLNDGGFIVLHDTCPDEEQCATAERNTKKWFGDVYKFAMNLHKYEGLKFITINIDCGITVCWKSGEVTLPKDIIKYTWEDYIKSWWLLMNVVRIEQVEETLNKLKEPVNIS